jgi:hypothetical protein
MPTVEQSQAYATKYQCLGREANISLRRATMLANISRSWKALASQIDRLSDLLKQEACKVASELLHRPVSANALVPFAKMTGPFQS